jgi:DNA topoisomerase-2
LDGAKINKKKIMLTPGMYKIFDEIVVNAADNKQRDPNMDKLDITIDAEHNMISVRNNGKGIPIVMHTSQGVYVPTLIFGHLLTGSNFDDEEKKTTGGRNGYGAKLANIFSTKFIVECVDTENGKKFVQTFTNNMKDHDEPKIKSLTAAEKKKGDYVKVTFHPDLERFQMSSMDADLVALLKKRAYDVAGSLSNSHGKKLSVSLNGTTLPIKSFKDYLGCFEGVKIPTAYEKDTRWEVGVGPTTEDGSSLQHISFVNGICTSSGGEHVNYIANQVITHLQKVLKKKNKGTEVPKAHIRNHLFIFVNCLIENPAFSSQTKENLTTRAKQFGSECKLSDKFLKQVEKSGVVDEILSFAKFKQNKAMKRHGGVKKSKLTGIAKLDDANHAGTAKSKNCTLIITEGDSAKSLAMSGLSVVGRDNYGVFPLKGKPLNVREASQAQVVKNEEIKNLVDILGLKFGMVYTPDNVKTLRYGHLMIMADQDHDGSHIKGLVINFLHYYWPGLLDIPDFLQQFITPIVKATKGKKSMTFFTLPEYETWKESTGNEGKGYKIKYYKGLGTSTAAEAKDYFSNLQIHEVRFGEISKDKTTIAKEEYMNVDDLDFVEPVPDEQVSGSDLIDMCFNKGRVEDRKTWLNNLQPDTYLNYSEAQGGCVNYSDFVNKELILFSQADNQRSIPHVMDGFKPSQRKVLFSCFKRKLKAEIKVAQLAGYISEHSAYHHGEASLTGTIIGMAQTFVGSNNINLLEPAGQFGTRRMGGKDSASPRYVFTRLEKIARLIFHPDDDPLLSYLNDDGLSIEPEFYMPVIPMILVNGSDGIGTGWSSTVPNYEPRAIIKNIRRLINGEDQETMHPFYDGYIGDIIPEDGKRQGSYRVVGKVERKDDTTLYVTELPIKKWTQDYKVFLETMMNGDPAKKIEADIKDFKENHTDATVAFTIVAAKETIDKMEKDPKGLLGKFKLTGSLSTSNMHLFDTQGRITKYATPEDILSQFFGWRLDYYDRRKELLLQTLKREQKILTNKARFIEEVCAGDLIVSNRKRKAILVDLQDRGYDLMEKAEEEKKAGDEVVEEEEEMSDAELAKGYEYLLGMKIWSLTYEKAEALRKQLGEKMAEVAELEATPPSQLWLNDLDNIDDALDERDTAMAAAAKGEAQAQKKSKKAQALKKMGGRKKKATDWDSDDESSEDDDSDSDAFVAKQVKKAPAKNPVVRKTAAAPKRSVIAAPPKRALEKAKPAAAPPKASVLEKIVQKEESEDEDSDLDIGVSLAERMKQKLMVSPPTKRNKPAQRVSSFDSEDEEEDKAFDLDMEDFKPASVTPARKKAAEKKEIAKPATEKAAPAAKKTAAQKPAAKKPVAKKAAAKKKVIELSDDESEDDFNEESESEVEEDVAPAPSRRGGGRARAKITYKVDFSDEEDDESDFDD